MKWGLIKDATLPSPKDGWERLQMTPLTPRSGLSRLRKLMNDTLVDYKITFPTLSEVRTFM